jgi:serum/glucocorticoid-regulated kinase 2
VLQEGSAHGKAVDWWAMGTLLYEMLNGLPPFYSQDVREMYDKILSERLVFPRHFRPHTQTFLAGLLERDPALRFDVGQIKAHPYFAGVDWGKLMRKEYQAPMTPNLRDELDLSYFDTQFTSQQPFESMQEDSSMRISVTNGLFEGFTYDQTAADAARLHTGDAAELSFLEEEEEEPAEQEPDAAADGALLGGDGGEL